MSCHLDIGDLIDTISELAEVLKDARQWVEANTAQVRGLSAEAAAPGEAMLKRIDAAIAAAKESI